MTGTAGRRRTASEQAGNVQENVVGRVFTGTQVAESAVWRRPALAAERVDA